MDEFDTFRAMDKFIKLYDPKNINTNSEVKPEEQFGLDNKNTNAHEKNKINEVNNQPMYNYNPTEENIEKIKNLEKRINKIHALFDQIDLGKTRQKSIETKNKKIYENSVNYYEKYLEFKDKYDRIIKQYRHANKLSDGDISSYYYDLDPTVVERELKDDGYIKK
jgi:hypothetical protein